MPSTSRIGAANSTNKGLDAGVGSDIVEITAGSSTLKMSLKLSLESKNVPKNVPR